MNTQQDSLERLCIHLWKYRKGDVTVLLIGVLFGAYFDWDLVEISVFLIFLWSLIGPLSSRILAAPALFFLSATPLLLALGKEDQAEQFAVYAYYFLVMAVIRAVAELHLEKEKVVNQ
jgi:hypothetical protein